MTIVQNILKIAKEHKVNNQKLCQILNSNPNKIYDWKVGKSKPTAEELCTLANYFDVTIDYLVGRTNEDTNTHYENNVSGINFSNLIQGSGSVTVNSSSNDYKKLTGEETEILDIYRSLNIEDKSTFLNFILKMKKENLQRFLKSELKHEKI